MHPSSTVASQQCIDISIEPFSVQPLRASIVGHGILLWWIYSDSGINSSHGWWPSQGAGWGHAYAWHHSKEEGKKKVQWDEAWSEKKGVIECKTASQEEWDYLIHGVSQIFPKRQFLDQSRYCWVEHWSARAGCYVFTLSHSFVVQLVTCEVWFSQLSTQIPMHALLADWQTTPALPCLSRCLTAAPNPPSTPTPLQSCSERDPTQNLEEEIRWWLFMLALAPSLPLYVFVWGGGAVNLDKAHQWSINEQWSRLHGYKWTINKNMLQLLSSKDLSTWLRPHKC